MSKINLLSSLRGQLVGSHEVGQVVLDPGEQMEVQEFVQHRAEIRVSFDGQRARASALEKLLA